MFFRLTNSPVTFQAMMNNMFRELISEGKIVVYLDNIHIFSQTLDEHRVIVKRVLQILRENKLYLKAEKCEFEKEEIRFLGIIIGYGRMCMDPEKVKAVAEWPEPKNKKTIAEIVGVRQFLPVIHQ